MKILGISPLDKDATASLVEDGRILFAAGEERYSRQKQHAGFPALAIAAALEATGTEPEQIDSVEYPFLEWQVEAKLIRAGLGEERSFLLSGGAPPLRPALRAADARARVSRQARTAPVHGLASPNQRMGKPLHKRLAYEWLGASALSRRVALRESRAWGARAVAAHEHWNDELHAGLRALGLAGKLHHSEHHLSHAANAYLMSGFDRALIVTLDGYGSGLAGSVSVGEGGVITRRQRLAFPHSLGTFYENVTGALGFSPDRHAGKIVGLAAYGDATVLEELLLDRFDRSRGDFRIREIMNSFFARHLAVRYPMVDVAAAWQRVLEVIATELVEHWIGESGCKNVVLSGGVTANVKMNQRIHEIDGVEGIFIYPNMGDGGCGTGVALHRSWPGGVGPTIAMPYFGPEFTDDEIERCLKAEGLEFTRPAHMAAEVARRIHAGDVVARFAGRMEYGPRALGNRSILYHGSEPEVNQWLNSRLGRTEFMPFAPVTLWEARERCYHGLAGAEHTAEFMTITFDCTDWMKENCPAAVHVDGTARPQLVRSEVNPEYHAIVAEYEKLSGIPCLINTSFNMHEEPIVCTPRDAVRAFLDGRLDGLAIGGFYVSRPDGTET
ncbi:MAG: carbamoyltransferase [Planctomycetes bacterium]|nr:carbamoyltransferase [Planctomycetota bacterium]MDP6409398.1 carbamoyltransferase C-terminal domain-containing protein [Planctomycetota bacterium]